MTFPNHDLGREPASDSEGGLGVPDRRNPWVVAK